MHGSHLLVIGGSSYMGQHLVPLALADTAVAAVTYTYYSRDPLQLPHGRQLDIRDETAVHQFLDQVRPAAVIHTAGSNRVDDLDAVIVRGTANVAAAATAVNARLIHISTDSIFDGLTPPYDESSPPTPVNAYGRAKARAEEQAARHPDCVIVRTSLIYGKQKMDHGTAWMSRALAAGEPITLFSNQRRNPVWLQTLNQACLELIDHPFTGVLNVAGAQVLTRAQFALKMFDWWGVTQRDSAAIAPSTGQNWPLDCELDLRLAAKILRTPLLGVDEVLAKD